MATTNLDAQNFFSTTLSAGISDTDTVIPLNSVPTPTEGYLTLESANNSKREIIYYTSKGASSVTVPASGGRGVGGTSAQAHSSGATVEMNMTADYFQALKDGTALDDNSITTAKIANSAVTASKIPDGELLPGKLTAKTYTTFLSANGLDGTSFVTRATVTIPAADLPGTGNYRVAFFIKKGATWAGQTGVSDSILAYRIDGGSDIVDGIHTSISGTHHHNISTMRVVTLSANTQHTIDLRTRQSIASPQHTVVDYLTGITAVILGKA